MTTFQTENAPSRISPSMRLYCRMSCHDQNAVPANSPDSDRVHQAIYAPAHQKVGLANRLAAPFGKGKRFGWAERRNFSHQSPQGQICCRGADRKNPCLAPTLIPGFTVFLLWSVGSGEQDAGWGQGGCSCTLCAISQKRFRRWYIRSKETKT